MELSELPALPMAPGVYLFWQDQSVVYVGKARNLRSRVASYFHNQGKPERIRTTATRLEFIITRDEVEALLLEANLIKAHTPKFNVLLKDDKHYPFLKLTNEPFPMLIITRRVTDDGGRYWGPFPDAGTVRRLKALIDRVFPLRKNSGLPMRRRRYPCLNYAMGRCYAPCVGEADPKAYAEAVAQVELLLSGRVEPLIEQLEQKMRAAAQAQNFEYAAEVRDQIQALHDFFATRQQAYVQDLADLDFLGLARAGAYSPGSDLRAAEAYSPGSDLRAAGDYLELQLYQMRAGKILGRTTRFLEDHSGSSDEEILASFARSYYLEASPLPPLILLPLEIEDRTALAKLLSQKAGHPVELQVPQRGEKKQLLEFAANNAAAGLKAELKSLERRGDHPALVQLTELLALSHRPFRIEGYDISNLMGEAVVASITAFEAAKPKRSDYRRIRIKSLTGHPDDYAAMEEAIYRRFSGSLADRLPVPDLLLIDGGIGQVRAAQKGLQRAQIEIPLVGLAKRSETLILPDGRSLSLPLTAPALQLLIYLRDETHNNGLRFNRKLRSEKTLRSIFDDIPGIGPARKEALLQNFSTLEELYATPLETLAGLPGMNRAAAQAVAEALATRLKSQRAN